VLSSWNNIQLLSVMTRVTVSRDVQSEPALGHAHGTLALASLLYLAARHPSYRPHPVSVLKSLPTLLANMHFGPRQSTPRWPMSTSAPMNGEVRTRIRPLDEWVCKTNQYSTYLMPGDIKVQRDCSLERLPYPIFLICTPASQWVAQPGNKNHINQQIKSQPSRFLK